MGLCEKGPRRQTSGGARSLCPYRRPLPARRLAPRGLFFFQILPPLQLQCRHMPPDSPELHYSAVDEMRVHPSRDRRKAAIILIAVIAVAAIGIGFTFFGDRASAVAIKDEEVAVEATTSVVSFARSLVEVPVTLDGGRIAAAYPLPQKGKAIVANLSEMKLYLFEDGVASTSYEILSRGRPGTAWETPPGSYAVKTKELEHYSTIGDVWMPFAMQFQGNFFIHGWPYYSSGTQVPEGYSGGCVRMGTDDMGEVYEFGEIGAPVIVLGGDATAENSPASGGYGLLPEAPKFPTLRAKSFVVGDLDTGDIFARRDDELVRPIASVAKLMTAAVDLELLNQYDETKISKQAVSTEESYGNLRAGETLAVSDLLYPLLLESSNDAAEALAEIAGRARFLGSMNDKAASIGLADTNFDDPAGLSAETKSTAADLL